MTQFEEVLEYFLAHGAKLYIPVPDFRVKLQNVRNFIFDWDGVFNRGIKMDPAGSPFSEPDSMGTNLMRLSVYLKTGEIPRMGILTGALNKGAQYFAGREYFDFMIRGYKNKNVALEKLVEKFDLLAGESLFAWDDILDLPVARWAGVSIQVRRDATPVFNGFAAERGLVDYQTANPGGAYAVREIAELFLTAWENHEECIQHRMDYSATYQAYLAEKAKRKVLEIKR